MNIINRKLLSNYRFSNQIVFAVNCEWEPWSSWSTCSNTCGTGTRNRIRRIRLHEENGGTCTGDSLETSQENCGACPPGNYINRHSSGGLLNLV